MQKIFQLFIFFLFVIPFVSSQQKQCQTDSDCVQLGKSVNRCINGICICEGSSGCSGYTTKAIVAGMLCTKSIATKKMTICTPDGRSKLRCIQRENGYVWQEHYPPCENGCQDTEDGGKAFCHACDYRSKCSKDKKKVFYCSHKERGKKREIIKINCPPEYVCRSTAFLAQDGRTEASAICEPANVEPGESCTMEQGMRCYHDTTFGERIGITKGSDYVLRCEQNLWQKQEQPCNYGCKTRAASMGAMYAYCACPEVLTWCDHGQHAFCNPDTGITTYTPCPYPHNLCSHNPETHKTKCLCSNTGVYDKQCKRGEELPINQDVVYKA